MTLGRSLLTQRNNVGLRIDRFMSFFQFCFFITLLNSPSFLTISCFNVKNSFHYFYFLFSGAFHKFRFSNLNTILAANNLASSPLSFYTSVSSVVFWTLRVVTDFPASPSIALSSGVIYKGSFLSHCWYWTSIYDYPWVFLSFAYVWCVTKALLRFEYHK